MVKTNRFIYPYKINWGIGLNLDFLKTNFPEEKEYDNFIKNGDYISLVFLGEEEGISFFSLIKGKGSNASICDFEQEEDIPHFLDENKKIKSCGLIAFLNDKDILLTLFNQEAFGYSTAALCKYLREKLGKDFTCEIITKNKTDEEIKKTVSGAKHIHIYKAQSHFVDFARHERATSKDKLKRWVETKEEIIKIQRISGSTDNFIMKQINKFKEQNPERIIVQCSNQEEIDILDDFYQRFPCLVNTDLDGLSLVSDFKSEIKRVVSQNRTLFDSF